MKFHTHELNKGAIISVEIDDAEYYTRTESTSLLRRFEISILNRLAMMVAGYYFKKHRDEIIKGIKIEDVNRIINEEISKRILKNLLEK